MITTRSKFYYGTTITESNYYINFNEGSGELTAQLRPIGFSLTDFAAEIARVLNNAGTQTYTVSVNRTTRQLTISAALAFDLLFSTGSNVGLSAYSVMGFTNSDYTATNTYTGENGAGKEYLPQLLLQNYIDFEDWKEFSGASINESANGTVESVSFGSVNFMQFNIMMASNKQWPKSHAVETNLTGVDDLRDFMDDIISKNNIEFIKDRDAPTTFDKVLLESTASNKNGVGYKLSEMYQKGFFDTYETKILKFRRV